MSDLAVGLICVAATAGLAIIGWLVVRVISRPDEELNETKKGVAEKLDELRDDMKSGFRDMKADLGRLSESHAGLSERLAVLEDWRQRLDRIPRGGTPSPILDDPSPKRRRSDR